jgi:hypothetical protein
MAKTSEELWDDAVESLPSIAQWGAIAIPIVFEMYQRLQTDLVEPCFCKIVYPGTNVTVFTTEQASRLEDLMREALSVDEQLEHDEEEEQEIRQVGGGVLPPDILKVAETIGSVAGAGVTFGKTALSLLSADTVSPDAWWNLFKHFIRTILPDLAKNIKDAAEIGGLTKYETVMSDINGTIPVPIPVPPFTIPVPYKIPSKMIIPLLAVFLDILRFTISTVPFVGTLTSLPFTLLLSLIELGKGRLYDSLITLFGLIGTNGIILSIFSKLLLGTIVLLQPAIDNIPDIVLDSGYKAGKAALLAALLQLFATTAPDLIRLPLTTFTETMKQAARKVNQQIETAMTTVAESTDDKVHLDMQMIDIGMIPSFMDILSIQRLVQNPALVAYPGVIDIVETLRAIPPFPLIIDLFNIPRKDSPEFQSMLAENPPGSIAQKFTPRLKIKNPSTGEYIDIKNADASTFLPATGVASVAGAAGATSLPTSVASLPTSLAGATSLPTSLAGATSLPTSLAGATSLPTSLAGAVPKTLKMKGGSIRRTKKNLRNRR